MIPGVTVKREMDDSSGQITTVVVEHKDDLNPQINLRQQEGNCYLRNSHGCTNRSK